MAFDTSVRLSLEGTVEEIAFIYFEVVFDDSFTEAINTFVATNSGHCFAV